MIDGLYPSQIMEVEAMRSSHYKNLKEIVNKNSNKLSFQSNNFLNISRHKKFNHNNWRAYNSMIVMEQTRFKKNMNLYEKLQKISNKRSVYAMKTEQSPPRDPLLHHNHLYQFHRRYQQIQKSNQMLASRIMHIKGDIDTKKQQAQFQTNKFNVSRLQKFERYKRLNRIVSKSLNQKFVYSTSRMSIKSETSLNPED